MPARQCTHIKTNGIKCGSPALRHHTKCYFHYQWQRREQRRVRLGGPVGMNKNTGIELPMLDSREAILLAIMEIQYALLDARIDRKTASVLLYGVQLAMQNKSGDLLYDQSRSVSACPELNDELEMDRARGLRPAADVCTSCPNSETCTSSDSCPNAPLRTILNLSSSRPESRSDVAEGPAFFSTSAPASTDCHAERSAAVSTPPAYATCHAERSAAIGVPGSFAAGVIARGAEAPFVSSPEAPVLHILPTPFTSSDSLRELPEAPPPLTFTTIPTGIPDYAPRK